MRRTPGWNTRGSAVRLDYAYLRRGRSQPGMSGRAAKPPMQASPAGWCPGRGPVPARRGDRERTYPRRRSLLIQAGTGPLRAGRRDEAGRPALPSRPRLGHITSARPRKHQLR